MFSKIAKFIFNLKLGQNLKVHEFYKWAWQHFGLRGIRLTNVGELKMYVMCRDWAIAPTMMFAHEWEPEETALCKEYIKEGMIVIDAGAYIGYYSMLASKLVGSKGKVYSFEPSPECLALLQKNIQLNDCTNIQVFEEAIADKVGHTTFYVKPYNVSGSTMFKDYSNPIGSHTLQVKVPTVTLDEAIGDSKVDFVKMDIEGGELKALKGMVNIIKNNPKMKLMVEVFPYGLVRIGSSLEELVKTLQSYFRLYIIKNGGLTDEVGLYDIQKAIDKIYVINLFCEGKGSNV